MWDTFKLDRANALFHELSQSKEMLNFFKIKNIVLENHKLVNNSKSKKYSIYRLVDLLQNVYRRMEEGKFDDALARIYRTFEYLVQLKLYNDYNSGSVGIASNKTASGEKGNIRHFVSMETGGNNATMSGNAYINYQWDLIEEKTLIK